MAVTMLQNMVDPEVMADMISAKLPNAIVATPFAKVDTTLEGRPGSTITVPKYEYIGDAEEIAEGVAQGDATLTTTTAEYTVKKIVKDVCLTDEDIEYIEDVRKENEELTKLHLRDIVSKNPKTDRKVTEKLIIDGLKFIAEHPGMDQEELTQALIDLGCDFSIDEINEQFPVSGLLMDGIEKGDLNCGANIVANVRDSEFGRAFAEDHFLSVDDEYSVYHFIRLRTGDESYTMERVRGQKMGL